MYLPHKSALPLGVRLRLWFGRFLLNREYVFLIDFDRQTTLSRAVRMDNKRFANRYRYLDDSWIELRPGGETEGLSFVQRWEPYL